MWKSNVYFIFSHLPTDKWDSISITKCWCQHFYLESMTRTWTLCFVVSIFIGLYNNEVYSPYYKPLDLKKKKVHSKLKENTPYIILQSSKGDKWILFSCTLCRKHVMHWTQIVFVFFKRYFSGSKWERV